MAGDENSLPPQREVAAENGDKVTGDAAVQASQNLSLEANAGLGTVDPSQQKQVDVSGQGFPGASVGANEITFSPPSDARGVADKLPAATTGNTEREPLAKVDSLKAAFPLSSSFPDSDKFFSSVVKAADRIAAAPPGEVSNVFSQALNQSLKDNPDAPPELFGKALNTAFAQNPDTPHLRVVTTSNSAQLRDARAVTAINPEGEVAEALHTPEAGVNPPLTPTEKTLAANLGQELAKMIDSKIAQLAPGQAKPFESIADQLVARQDGAGLLSQMPEIGARARPENGDGKDKQLLDLIAKRPTIFNEVADPQALARDTMALADAVAFANPQDMPNVAIEALNFLANTHKVENGKDLGALFGTALNIVSGSQDFSFGNVFPSPKGIDMGQLADRRLANPSNPQGVFAIAAFHTSIDAASRNTVALANQTANIFTARLRDTARGEGQKQLSDDLLARIGKVVNLAPLSK